MEKMSDKRSSNRHKRNASPDNILTEQLPNFYSGGLNNYLDSESAKGEKTIFLILEIFNRIALTRFNPF
jgi:hypothetical protein